MNEYAPSLSKLQHEESLRKPYAEICTYGLTRRRARHARPYSSGNPSFLDRKIRPECAKVVLPSLASFAPLRETLWDGASFK